ncbi:polysaccharide deacetylase family protein [Aquibacillus koreensis]|uniref:Polysaccharide deacetylase family protein n=1 Tax=Aquibacillus koreensis TaxID=279446 RepID=A0A9X3WM69_9BACI|nr:polysaccharide deacetylase family protein [Aquibacillus koreensis]MCT2536284.1 polysaccharide deacetylase family protein [Aquibacillus koreensis]MDC3421365.1 polysaccharide deacetylase family protein [Aquibacillus koreensis]
MYTFLKKIVFAVCFLLFCAIQPEITVIAQPEELPNLEDGSEYKERIKNPVSNIVLQQRYPEAVVLSGSPTDNTVALTFDDGPDPRFTPQILDVLKEYDVKATFFLLGSRAAAFPDLVQRIQDEGHVISNHTYWHPNLVEQADIGVLENEVTRTENELAEQIGYKTKLFRAPYGFLYDELVEKLAVMNYSVVGWSVDSLDWQESPPEEIAYNVLNNIHPGAIILMHDGAEWEGDRTNTIKSLRQIIPALQEQGFAFETVPELLNIPYKK